MGHNQGKEVDARREKTPHSREFDRRIETGYDRRKEILGQRQAISERDRVEAALGRLQAEQGEKQADRTAKAGIAENIVSKSFPLHEERRGDNARDLHFRDNEAFAEEYRKRSSEKSPDTRQVLGFYDGRDNQAFVRDQGNTLETSVHEKLHQKSKSELPTRLNEGITEHFTRQGAGEIGRLKNIDNRGREISQPVSDYEREREIVGKLSGTIGEAPLNAAYFDGNSDELRQHVDNAFGQGSLQELSDALEARDYDRAEGIIKRG